MVLLGPFLGPHLKPERNTYIVEIDSECGGENYQPDELYGIIFFFLNPSEYLSASAHVPTPFVRTSSLLREDMSECLSLVIGG